MKRRDFIVSMCTIGVAFPSAATAQKQGRRHVGIFWGGPEDATMQARLDVFVRTLRQLGWIEGENLRLSKRWGGEDMYTAEQARSLVELQPDVILSGPTNAVVPLMAATKTIPIVFLGVSDPVGNNIVDSLARPTGNATGFSNLEFSLVGKWIQLLKDAVPNLKRAGLMIYVLNASSSKWYQAFAEIAPTFSVEPMPLPVREEKEIEQIIASLAAKSDAGLIVAGDSLVERPHIRPHLVATVAKHKVPAIYGVLSYIKEGAFLVLAPTLLSRTEKLPPTFIEY